MGGVSSGWAESDVGGRGPGWEIALKENQAGLSVKIVRQTSFGPTAMGVGPP